MENFINKYIRPKDCAKYLGVSLATYWNYVKAGKIKTKKLSPRVTVTSIEDLEAFVNAEVS